MAVYTEVSSEALIEFLARFDVGELVSSKGIAEGVENSNYLVETTQGRFILTLYEKRVDAADLPYFMALLDHLADKGLPVPPAVPDKSGEEIHELCGRPACLIRFLPGVSVTRPTSGQAQAAGRALAEMHRAVADFSRDRENTMGQPTWRPLFERCGDSLDRIAPGLQADLGRAIEDVAANWHRFETGEKTELDRCAIHADLFPDNVLMLGDRVTGLIDFYFACTDFRLYDLAVMHAAWAFDATGTSFDKSIGDALVDGYTTLFPLSDDEQAAFGDLAVGACVRFTLSRAWDWLNTPEDAVVTRKDPLAFWRRVKIYDPDLAAKLPTLS